MRQHYPLNSQGAEDAGTLPWTDGVPSTGTEGSYFGHALFTDAEAEILAAIDASGQARNGSDLTQLVQAIARGVYLGQFSGTVNALAASLPNGTIFASLMRNTRLGGFVTTTNTGGVTVAISGIGPRTAPGTVTAPLLRRNGTALQSGDLPVNQDFEIRWDGNAFRMAGSVASDGGGSGSGGLLNVQVLTVSGTYTKTPGTKRIKVIATAGGGAGGGASGGGSNASAGVGDGGEGGMTAFAFFDVSSITSLPFTIGAAGVPSPVNTAGGIRSGSGGNTTFGSSGSGPYISVLGGKGGYQLTVPATGDAAGGTVGGVVTGAISSVILPGNPGGKTGAAGTAGWGGVGGASYWGGAGNVAESNQPDGSNTARPGAPATGYGSGGGGADTGNTGGNVQGGPGMQGIVYIEEYA